MARRRGANEDVVSVRGAGAQAASVTENVLSPKPTSETNRQDHFASPETVEEDAAFDYTTPATLALNQWGLKGRWRLTGESAEITKGPWRDHLPLSRARFAFGFRIRHADSLPCFTRRKSARHESRRGYG